MQIFEQKIIGGIINGTVQPSAVSLEPSDFTNADLGQCLTIARQLEIQRVKIDPEILCSRLTEADSGFYSPDDFRLMSKSVSSASVVYEAIDRIKAASLKAYLIEQASDLALQEN